MKKVIIVIFMIGIAFTADSQTKSVSLSTEGNIAEYLQKTFTDALANVVTTISGPEITEESRKIKISEYSTIVKWSYFAAKSRGITLQIEEQKIFTETCATCNMNCVARYTQCLLGAGTPYGEALCEANLYYCLKRCPCPMND